MIFDEWQSNFGVLIDALWLCLYFTVLFKCFQFLFISYSYLAQATRSISEILNTVSVSVFGSFASFSLVEEISLTSASDCIFSNMLV